MCSFIVNQLGYELSEESTNYRSLLCRICIYVTSTLSLVGLAQKYLPQAHLILGVWGVRNGEKCKFNPVLIPGSTRGCPY